MKTINWKPTPGKVVVEIEAKDETVSGAGKIILLGKGAEEVNTGRIIAVPDDGIVDGQEITPFVQMGDRVVFGKYAGTELSLSTDRRRRIVVMREVDILCVIEEMDSVSEVSDPPAEIASTDEELRLAL